MASPAKRRRTVEEDSLVGYLHSPSPTKTSKKNTRYFDATIQTGREEYHRVVVFSPQKRQAYEQAALAKTPVKLTHVRKTLTVRVKILPGGVVSRFVVVGGVSRELREFRICDRSGQTNVTLWEEKIAMVNVSKSYEISKLSTRRFKEQTTLTSTFYTSITEIQDVGEPRDLVEICGCVTAVKVSARRQCRRCHAVQKEYKERCVTHCCERCEMLQRASSYAVMYSGTLAVLSNGEEHTLMLTNSVVSTFLSEHLGGAASGHAEMQEKLVRTENVEVQVDSDQVVMSIKLSEEEAQGFVSSQAGTSADLLAEFERLAGLHPLD
ncbi:unnamed protein product [Merluccius merluccius]